MARRLDWHRISASLTRPRPKSCATPAPASTAPAARCSRSITLTPLAGRGRGEGLVAATLCLQGGAPTPKFRLPPPERRATIRSIEGRRAPMAALTGFVEDLDA